MKTKLLLFLLSCLATGALAQGQVQFRTFVLGTGSIPLVDAPVGPLNEDQTQWRAALLGGPTTLTPASLWGPSTAGTLPMLRHPTIPTVTWTTFSGSPLTGYVSSSNTAREVPGVDWGGMALIQMVAWDGPYNSWVDAFNAAMTDPNVRIGVSNPLLLTLPSGPGDPNVTYLVGLQGFDIDVVPEPSTFALAGLGIAAVLFFRTPRKVC